MKGRVTKWRQCRTPSHGCTRSWYARRAGWTLVVDFRGGSGFLTVGHLHRSTREGPVEVEACRGPWVSLAVAQRTCEALASQRGAHE